MYSYQKCANTYKIYEILDMLNMLKPYKVKDLKFAVLKRRNKARNFYMMYLKYILTLLSLRRSVQSSVHAMDMIAYYKSQTLAQRKAGGAITIPSLTSSDRHGTEVLFPTTHQHLIQVSSALTALKLYYQRRLPSHKLENITDLSVSDMNSKLLCNLVLFGDCDLDVNTNIIIIKKQSSLLQTRNDCVSIFRC